MNNQLWTVRKNGNVQGEYSLQQLIDSASSVQTLAGIEVMHPSHTKNQWVPVSKVKPVVEAFANKPTPSPTNPQPTFTCPFCGSHAGVNEVYKTSQMGWIIVIGLLLFLCFPLFWIGFFFRDRTLYCRSCNMALSRD